ncbi:hypothetical protein AB0L13_21740 [Saccharopolyspora shandongensis]|uniref:hypothetical protein n=1 Tax=Saccharopolyspora shandongensis TaxID=418495 RepID=UPI00341BF804
MGWSLETPGGESIDVNAWNWRPTLVLLAQYDLLDAEKLELLGYNCFERVTGEEAGRIAAFLDDYLATVPDDGRVRLDGSVTTEPDDYQLQGEDPAKNYSAAHAWLTEFRDFCRQADDGFVAG